MASAEVLFLDDEQNVLNAIKRLFHDDDISIAALADAAFALDQIREEQVPVIISDNAMPGMSGIEFLEQVRIVSPDSVRILMTGHASLDVALDAINRGEVYKFITKPWDDCQLRETVLNALSRHRVVASMKQGNEATLLSLAQTIELKDPYTRGHCDRVAQYAQKTAALLGMSEEDVRYIRQGSWLHDCGKIGVPEAILNYDGPLLPEQMEVVKNHSRWGADVARLAKLPDPVVSIILHHHERYDGSGYPYGLKGEAIPYHARIVAIADFYDALASDRPYRKALPSGKALEIMHESRGRYVDPYIYGIFFGMIGSI